MNDEQQSDSGFLHGESLVLSRQFKDISPLHESKGGFSRLFRAQRMGKWQVLKCLKPEFAQQAEYRALLQKEFEAMDILEKNPAKGAGSHGSGSSSQTTLAGVATQVQANDVITKMLLERGIAKTSLKFGEEYKKLWDENHCGDLPLQ